MLSPGNLIRNLTPLTLQRRTEIGARILSIVASNWLWLAIIAALTLVLYGPILGHWFRGDDFIHLRAGKFIGPLGFVREAFDFTGYGAHDSLAEFVRDESIPLAFLSYRPLTFIALEGMYLAFGDNPLGYHAISLLVHLANVLVLWFIAMRLFKRAPAAHLAALIFALHPVYVVTVSWIADIGTPLSTLAALLSFLFFMKSRDTDPSSVNWLIASFYLFGASVFFHQQTLSWAAVFVAYFFLLDRNGVRDRWNPRRWAVLSPFLALAGIAYYFQRAILVETPGNQASFTIGTHMLTRFKNYSSNALFPVFADWSEVHFIAFVSFLVILLSVVLMARLRRTKDFHPNFGLFAAIWFLAALAPLLTPVLPGGDLFGNISTVGLFKRKLYVAGPSLAILLVAFGSLVKDFIPTRFAIHARVLAVPLLIAALFGAMNQAIPDRDGSGEFAEIYEDFIVALQTEHASIPEGGTLYVVNAPPTLLVFTDQYLVSSVQAFYGKVRVVAISESQATAIESSDLVRPAFLGPPPTIFRYEGP